MRSRWLIRAEVRASSAGARLAASALDRGRYARRETESPLPISVLNGERVRACPGEGRG